MARVSVEQAGSANILAMLDAIAMSEGTATDPITQDDGYDVLVTGVNGRARFSSYAAHPDILILVNSAGLTSTAAGRYQLLHRYWVAYSAQLALPDFSPVSQDLIAIQQMRECSALQPLIEGDLSHAVALIAHLWASLPGAGYGQHQNDFDTIQKFYTDAGGVLA